MAARDWRQVSEACPECGSFYRRGDFCNRCKAFAPVKDESEEQVFSREGWAPRGRIWDSKLHRYVR
jgi:methionyl-tRNA synthetase